MFGVLAHIDEVTEEWDNYPSGPVEADGHFSLINQQGNVVQPHRHENCGASKFHTIKG